MIMRLLSNHVLISECSSIMRREERGVRSSRMAGFVAQDEEDHGERMRRREKQDNKNRKTGVIALWRIVILVRVGDLCQLAARQQHE